MIIGFLIDITGTVGTALYVLGAAFIVAGLLSGATAIMQHRYSKTAQEDTEQCLVNRNTYTAYDDLTAEVFGDVNNYTFENFQPIDYKLDLTLQPQNPKDVTSTRL